MDSCDGSWKHRCWTFSARQGKLATSSQIDRLESEIGIHPLPDIVFPESQVTIEGPHFSLNFNTSESLKFCKFSEMDGFAVKQLTPLQVKDAAIWREGRQHTPRLEIDHDWTFSTSYRGTVNRKFVDNAACLPVELLTNENIPILHFGNIVLWEDELHDNGGCEFSVKYRVTDVYWYVLAEYSLHLIGVGSRKIQTRYLHVFGEATILREFKCQDTSDSPMNICTTSRLVLTSP